MARLIGIAGLVVVLYGLLLYSDDSARSLASQQGVLKRIGQYGILTLGAGTLILAGGIDLSIGAVVGLAAVGFGLLMEAGFAPLRAFGMVIGVSMCLGLIHGLLVVYLRLQPFLVTLCGLFIYRGLAQVATWWPDGNSARNVGVGILSEKFEDMPDKLSQLDQFKHLASDATWGVPNFFWIMLALMVVVGCVLKFTVIGRYLQAVGHNESAARYAGIATARYRILAYVFCAAMAGLYGCLYLLEYSTAGPSDAGQWLELYAITGAVLGGCSMRGGEGTAVGMVLGAAVLPLLRTLVIFYGIPTDLEYAVFGVTLLAGTIADELFRRRGERKV